MTRFDLVKEMSSITREMDQMFRDIGFGQLLEMAQAPQMRAHNTPRINLRETDDCYIVETELPGIDPKELEITLLKETLTLSGERKAPEQEVGSWHRRERNTGKFKRAIDLPAETDMQKVRAEYQEGLLTVTLPKAETVHPKRIEIKAN